MENKLQRAAFAVSLLFCSYLFSVHSLIAQDCECNEYIYLNEPTTGGAVHKYLVSATGTLEDNEIGMPWFDNSVAGEGLGSPHGVAIDINGFVYIGERNTPDNEIRRFTCDGMIAPESDFSITTPGQYNIMSIGNNIFINPRGDSGDTDTQQIDQYDVCNPGAGIISSAQFCENFGGVFDWGFFVDPRTEIFYATQGFDNDDNYFWQFTIDDFDNDNSTCIDAIDLGPNFPADNADVRGLTTDIDRNIYIVVQDDNNLPDSPTYLLKFGPGPNYPFLARSAFDIAEDGSGFRKAIGIVYSELLDQLYVSTESEVDDCVSLFSKDLDYLGPQVPSPNSGDAGKGIFIIKECCPQPRISNDPVTMILCVGPNTEDIILNDVFPCDGTVCEAQWEPDAATDPFYDDCSQTLVTGGLPNGCYTFTRSGADPASQCGIFTQVFVVEVVAVPDISVAGEQEITCGGSPTDLVATTTGTVTRWERNTVACGADDAWEAIPSTAGLNTYNPGAVGQTTFYRAILTGTAGECLTGNCDLPSNCVEITVNTAQASAVLDITPVSCNGLIAQTDATINLTGVTNADVAGISSANATSYDGSPYDAAAAATDLMTISGTGTASFTGLSANTVYWIRVFNSSNTCAADYQITIPPDDCAGNCTVPTATLTSTASTCNGSMESDNGSITLTTSADATNYGISNANPSGGIYDGPTSIGAMTPAIPGDGSSIFSAGTHAGAMYVVRIFNTIDGCFDDFPVTIPAGGTCCVEPAVTLTPSTGSCTGTTINDDASVAISIDAGSTATEAGIIAGTDYDAAGGPAFGSASTINVSSSSGTFINLMHGTAYVVRVFNGAANCFDDFTVTTPTLTIPTMTGATVCEGATTTVMGSGTPAASNPYTSSNTAIATVNDAGLVTGISAGTVQITYTNSDGCAVLADVTIEPASTVDAVTSFTSCSDRVINLSDLNVNATQVASGQWMTSGDGMFDVGGAFGFATTYTPGDDDLSNGGAILTLTITSSSATCPAVSTDIEIVILQVDCGTFPWTGND